MAQKPPRLRRPSVGAARENVELASKFQGVIITDCFSDEFRPISNELPPVLFPIANIALLDMTVEFLVAAGVVELFIISSDHSDMIRDHCRASRRSKAAYRGVELHTIACPSSGAPGDSLRELERRHLVSGDFVLVNGPIVSNMGLLQALKEHQDRRKSDPNSIMTVVLKKKNPRSYRTNDVQLAIARDRPTGQILMYENVKKVSKVKIDKDVFRKRQEVELRLDLQDCSLAMCAPELLAVIADNFDWMSIGEDVIYGFLSSDVMGYKVYSHIIDNEYVGSVSTVSEYRWVAQDILRRWTYPLVPDSNLFGLTTFQYSRGNVYREKNVRLARGAELKILTLVGEGTSVGQRTVISHSTIGRYCVIGSNCVIEGSALWDQVKVADGVQIIDSIVCDGAVIKKHARVLRSVISEAVMIGTRFMCEDRRVRCGLCVSLQEKQGVLPDRDVGKDGIGSFCICNEKEAESENDMSEDERDLLGESEGEVEGEDETFYDEVISTVTRDMKSNQPPETIALEVKSLRMTSGQPNFEALCAALSGMLDYVPSEEVEPKAYFQAVCKVIQEQHRVLKHFYDEESDEIPLIHFIEGYCEGKAQEIQQVFQLIVKTLYELDFLSEDAIMEWSKNRMGRDLTKKYLGLSQQLLTWLESAEEESSEED